MVFKDDRRSICPTIGKKSQEEEDTTAARKKELAKRHETKDDEMLKRVNGSEDHDDNDPDTIKTRIRKKKSFSDIPGAP